MAISHSILNMLDLFFLIVRGNTVNLFNLIIIIIIIIMIIIIIIIVLVILLPRKYGRMRILASMRERDRRRLVGSQVMEKENCNFGLRIFGDTQISDKWNICYLINHIAFEIQKS